MDITSQLLQGYTRKPGTCIYIYSCVLACTLCLLPPRGSICIVGVSGNTFLVQHRPWSIRNLFSREDFIVLYTTVLQLNQQHAQSTCMSCSLCPSVKNMKGSHKLVKKFFCTCIHSFIHTRWIWDDTKCSRNCLFFTLCHCLSLWLGLDWFTLTYSASTRQWRSSFRLLGF